MIFSIIGGCVEDRTGVLLDFPRFPSSIIMTRETPAVVVSRTVFEGEKVWKNMVWQTRAPISLNSTAFLVSLIHFCERLCSRRSNSSSRSRRWSPLRCRSYRVRRGRREKEKGASSTLNASFNLAWQGCKNARACV